MKAKFLAVSTIFLAIVCSLQAQETHKVLIADGNQLQFGKILNFSTSTEAVFDFIKNTKLSAVPFGVDEKCYRSEISPNQQSDNLSVYDYVEGHFTSGKFLVTAYLYYGCDNSINKKYSGILMLRQPDAKKQSAKPVFIANYQFKYHGETAIRTLEDLNGDGLDELVLYSGESKMKRSVRLLEFSPTEIKSNVHVIYDLDKKPAVYSKIYAEKVADGSPKFYEEVYTMTAKGWVKGNPREISLDTDATKYYGSGVSAGTKVMKSAVFLIFIIQLIAFILLIGYLIYQCFVFLTEDSTIKEAAQKAKMERKTGSASAITFDELPKLDPINCNNCGSPVPLQEGEMACPSCGTKSSAPSSYFDIAKARHLINDKLHNAERAFRRAKWLASGWTRSLLGLVPVVLLLSMIAMFVWINKGVFEPYQNYLVGDTSAAVFFGFGSFSNLFWIVSLAFGFWIWSPHLKKALPTIESTENIATAETAKCSNCGGGISYQANDLATVCGYCGTETYRAKLAWKLRKLTNSAKERASFSLIESQKAVDDAIWEITGTPVVFGGLLLTVAIFAAVAFLGSSAYEMLPAPIREVFEFIGEILSMF